MCNALPKALPPAGAIVVRGVNWLGDAVMTTPALGRLRERYPSARIVLVTPEKLRGLWVGHPAVDELIPIEPGEGIWAVARKLRGTAWGAALVFPNSPRSAMELWLARVPVRVGYAGHWRSWCLTHPVREAVDRVMRKRSAREVQRLLASAADLPTRAGSPDARRHHLYRYLDLAAVLGADAREQPPFVQVTEAELQQVIEGHALSCWRGGGRPWVGLNAGAEYGPAKRWPVESFVETVLQVQRQVDCVWLLLGGKRDMEWAERLAVEVHQRTRGGRAATLVTLAGNTSLRELCGLLKACDVVLTNDTGPMHVAAAVGTPVVALFGSTSPELTGPGLPGDSKHALMRVPVTCAPCFLRECPVDMRCLRGIGVGSVAAALVERLRR